VVRRVRSGQVLLEKEEQAAQMETPYDEKSLLSIEGALDFADSVQIEDIRAVVQRQIEDNLRIAQEGLRGDYGANIGSVLLHHCGDDVMVRAKAYAAAGSDARMNGCELPVVIVSGSGNQGITACVPVVIYAQELGVSEEKLLRAVVLSDLVTIHQKSGIGRLSAYCGAVSAGCGAGAGIAYLYGGGYEEIAHTVVNALAIVSGVVCDGAKASCAAKIAAAVDAGILGYRMYQSGQQFVGGDGIVSKGVENTIKNVGRLARDGMKETDQEIIKIMLG
jgi:L-cysteine desulfidase